MSENFWLRLVFSRRKSFAVTMPQQMGSREDLNMILNNMHLINF